MGQQLSKIGKFIKKNVRPPAKIARMGETFGKCDCSWCHAMEYETGRSLSDMGFKGKRHKF